MITSHGFCLGGGRYLFFYSRVLTMLGKRVCFIAKKKKKKKQIGENVWLIIMF